MDCLVVREHRDNSVTVTWYHLEQYQASSRASSELVSSMLEDDKHPDGTT